MGRNYLAHLAGQDSYEGGGAITEERRIHYMGFGIGSKRQICMNLVNVPPYSTYYPGTHLQDSRYPTMPTISKLERPILITGEWIDDEPVGTWLKEPPLPGFWASFMTPGEGEVVYHSVINSDIEIFLMGPVFYEMPISEIALFLSDADPSVKDNPAVAYHSFATILFMQGMQMEVLWKVRF